MEEVKEYLKEMANDEIRRRVECVFGEEKEGRSSGEYLKTLPLLA